VGADQAAGGLPAVGPALLPGRVEFRQGASSLRLDYVHCWTDRRLRRELFLEATHRPDSRLME